MKPLPIMSWEHWPQAWQSFDLTDYHHGCLSGAAAHAWLTQALRQRNPFSLCNLSDGDIAVWVYHELLTVPEIQVEWIQKLADTNGISRLEDRFLWPLLDVCCQQTSAWLVQDHWDIAARLSYCCMTLKGVEIRPEGFWYHGQQKQKVDCEAVYSFAQQGHLLPAIKGRRVAVLGGLHEPLTESLRASGVNVVVSCAFPRSVHAPKLPAVPHILETLFHEDWDLLLCSTGGYSPLFCDFAAQQGRQGFDIGSADSILITGKRFHAQFQNQTDVRKNPVQ